MWRFESSAAPAFTDEPATAFAAHARRPLRKFPRCLLLLPKQLRRRSKPSIASHAQPTTSPTRATPQPADALPAWPTNAPARPHRGQENRSPARSSPRPRDRRMEAAAAALPRPARRLRTGCRQDALCELRRGARLLPSLGNPVGRLLLPWSTVPRTRTCSVPTPSAAPCNSPTSGRTSPSTGRRDHHCRRKIARFGVGEGTDRRRLSAATTGSNCSPSRLAERDLMLSGAPLVHELPGRMGWEIPLYRPGAALPSLEANCRRGRRHLPSPPETSCIRLAASRRSSAYDVAHESGDYCQRRRSSGSSFYYSFLGACHLSAARDHRALCFLPRSG